MKGGGQNLCTEHHRLRHTLAIIPYVIVRAVVSAL